MKKLLTLWMFALLAACTVVIEQPTPEEPEEPIPIPQPDPDPDPVPPTEVIGELVADVEQQGTPSIVINSLEFLSVNKVGWGADWKPWAGTGGELTINENGSYTFNGTNTVLDFTETYNVIPVNDTQMRWDYTVTTNSELTAIGNAIEFRLNTSLNPEVTVTLLDNNRGFTIQGFRDFPDSPIRVEFSEGLKDVNFERPTNPNNIRAYFLKDQIVPETIEFSMTITVPLRITIGKTAEERLGSTDVTGWYHSEDLIDYYQSPVDLSYMNASEIPAGKRGWLKNVDGDLQFDDGTPVRFWGTNISAATIFGTSDTDIPLIAKRLSKLGYNMVRIHHHDSYWVNPTIFGDQTSPDYGTGLINIDKIDRWIAALKAEGIYVWLDMEVQRPYTIRDNLTNWAEIDARYGKDHPRLGRYVTNHGFNYIDEDIQRLQRENLTEYLTHVNPYTGSSYLSDPAIAWIQFYNENDLTNHYGHMFLANKNVPTYSDYFLGEADKFAVTHRLDTTTVGKTWVAGASKLFANDMEHRNNTRMRDQALSIGFKGLMSSTSQWSHQPQFSLTALAAQDLIDVHSYGDFNDVSLNPRYVPSFHHFISASQVNGLPLSISEWNIETVNNSYDRFVSPIQIATLASFQGWDVPMEFGYGGASITNRWGNGTYASYGDPAMTSTLIAGAIMYREGHVSPANETYVLSFSSEDHYYRFLSPKDSLTLRTLPEQHRVLIDIPEHNSLPWYTPPEVPSNATVVTDPDVDFIPMEQTYTQFDTGEVTRDWKKGTLIVNTEKSQSFNGWLGGKTLVTEDVVIVVENTIGSVTVQSLDGKPISTSRDILISLASRTLWNGSQKTYWSEPLVGLVQINSLDGLDLYTVDKFGSETKATADRYQWEEGYYNLELGDLQGTYWLRLKE